MSTPDLSVVLALIAPARPTAVPVERPDYVTVMPAAPRSGWMVGHRLPKGIEHVRIDASIHDREAARRQAAALFPDHVVYVQGDEVKPWL